MPEREAKVEGQGAGYYWTTQALLAGYSVLLLKENAGTLPFLMNQVTSPISKDNSLPNK